MTARRKVEIVIVALACLNLAIYGAKVLLR